MRSKLNKGGLGALVLALAALAPAAQAEADVLQRPAMPSAKAATSVLLAIAQAGKRVVAAGERGIVVYSDDASASWRQAAVPVSVSLTSLRFVNERDGWAVGHGGVVLRTRDGGKSWTRQLDGKQAAQLLLAAVQARHAAEAGTPARALLDAERLVAEGASKPFLDLHFFDDKNGMVVGAFGLVFATADGGETWQPAFDRIQNPNGKHLYAIQASGDACFIAGEQGAVFYSSDRGKRFTALATPYAGTYFGAVAAGPRAVLVFGMRGNAYWTDNAGASWNKSDIATSASLASGARLQDGSLILADDTGHVYRSKDAGKSFQAVPVSRSSPFTGLVQTEGGQLLFSGVRGITRIALKEAQHE